MTRRYSEEVSRVLSSAKDRYALPHLARADSGPLPCQRFSVAGEAKGLQAPAWSAYVGRSVHVPVMRAQVASGFRGEIRSYALKDLIYMQLQTDPVVQSRTLDRISADSLRDYVFHVAIEGIIETETAASRQSRTSQFMPGILALDMSQPMRMVRPTFAKVLAFFVPRKIVEARIVDAPRIHGRVVGYTTPLTRLLLDHLQHLHRNLDGMEAASAESALRVGTDLIVAAFAKQARLGDSARAAARSAIRGQIQRHVQANLHRPNLSPDSVLQAFALPRPTLYRLFEAEGGLAAYIRHCRLREAAEELSGMPSLAIRDIAERLSFSAPDFTRAFRRSYGMSPQEFRVLGKELLRA